MADISHRCMLVALSRRVWQAATVDRDLAEQAESEAGAEHGTFKLVKALAPREYLEPIKRIADFGYTEHCRMTVPGFVRGQNLLATAAFDQYVEVQRLIKNKFGETVDDFKKVYPSILKNAPRRLNRGYKASDFPSVEEIDQYFDYSFSFFPVPSVEDWRVDGLQDDQREELRIEADKKVAAMYDNATREVFERARKVLEKIRDQAMNYVGGPGASLLRDATIENLKEISDLVLLMNITNDPELNRIGNDMVAEFGNLEGHELRRNEQMRNDVATAASRILARMKANS